MKWYRKAADQGIGEAQSNLGYSYEKGIGVEQDFAEAVMWYRMAAGQGIADAQYNLGRCYENGMGVKKDSGEAAKWCRKAAATKAGVSAGNSTAVDMVKKAGVLEVPAQLNGSVSLKFIVDSGAACIVIPRDVFLTLMRAETIQKKDLLPSQKLTLADGSNVVYDRFILRSIKVGGSTISDVEASVGGVGAPLLLGQSFLSRFDEVKVDNKSRKLILTK